MRLNYSEIDNNIKFMEVTVMTVNKSIFEQNGGTYRQVGDYLIPNLELPAEEKEVHIGIWGMRRKNYLMQNDRVLFNIMLTNGNLWTHLIETDKQAEEMFSRMVNEMAHAEGVNEELKAEDQFAWVKLMNNIRNRAKGIVNSEIIYA